MESSSVSSRFRFRDLPEMENSSQSGTASDVSSDRDEEEELQSMTGKGIKHLCSELLELKAVSDEDFHKHIFSNYLSFIRIFEEVGRVETELTQLKSHVLTQKRLVNDLADGIFSKVLLMESVDMVTEESECDESPPISELEAHANEVLETLDILLSENRIDEALAIFELEDVNLQRMQFEEDYRVDELRLFDSAISERKTMLTQHLMLVAENPRISAAELQRALVGFCRLGDSHLATKLLLKYYHSRIAFGIHNLKASKVLLDRVYIMELSKFVFSMISQAAKSFGMLYGENSPYASEVIQWACEETKVYAVCFDKYVKSISEISGGLSTAVEAVQFAISFCSLLETQRLVLRPYLIKHIRPCMEEVLHVHLDHFMKVISIFTMTDTWVLGRYLVSGIMNEGCSSMVVGQQPEYCLLTNSGRKFVTLLQAITVDVSPLLAVKMEGSILGGLMNLFKKYIEILERAINCDTTVTEITSSRINLAESVQQQVSVLANLSSLEQLFSNMVCSIFKGNSDTILELTKIHPDGYLQQEIDSCIFSIQEASFVIRALFCEKYVNKIKSLETSYKLTPAIWIESQGESHMFRGRMPSLTFQVLFLELRKLEKLSEDNVFEVDWLMELLGELIEAVFVWISNNKEIWHSDEENMTVEHPLTFNQFVLDVQFLVEITKYGGYFSNNPLLLMNLMKSAFLSAGLDPRRDVSDDRWAIDSAAETIKKLLDIEKEHMSLDQEPSGGEEVDKSNDAADSFQDDAKCFKEDAAAIDDPAVACNAELKSLDTEQCIDQSKNGTDSLQEDASISFEGSVEQEKDEVASYEPVVPFNAESASLDTGHDYQEEDVVASYDQEVSFNALTTPSLEAEQSESNGTDSVEDDAASTSENYMQSEENVVDRFNSQFSNNAETGLPNTKSGAEGVSASDGSATSLTEIFLETQNAGIDNSSNITDLLEIIEETNVPKALLPVNTIHEASRMQVPDADGNSIEGTATNLTETSLETQNAGLDNLSNKTADLLEAIEEIKVPQALLPITTILEASEMRVPDEGAGEFQSATTK